MATIDDVDPEKLTRGVLKSFRSTLADMLREEARTDGWIRPENWDRLRWHVEEWIAYYTKRVGEATETPHDIG